MEPLPNITCIHQWYPNSSYFCRVVLRKIFVLLTCILLSLLKADLFIRYPCARKEGSKNAFSIKKGEREGMGSEGLHAVKVCRHLLKSVKKHIGQEDYKRHFSDFIMEEFKKNRGLLDPSSLQNKLKLARDYTFLLNSVHHHQVFCSLALLFVQWSFIYRQLDIHRRRSHNLFLSCSFYV